MPRLDRIHRWRRAQAVRNNISDASQVLFFSFWRKEKLTGTGIWEELSWTCLCEETHKAVIEIAKRNPRARVVIKTKPLGPRIKDIWHILRQTGQELPPNVAVISDGDSFPLIAESCVVIGFNSTSLLEALAAGKPVLVPQFAEAADPRMRSLVIDLGEAIEHANSPEELVRMASAHLNGYSARPYELSAAVSRALTYWVGNPDGHAGQRVLKAVHAEIARFKAP